VTTPRDRASNERRPGGEGRPRSREKRLLATNRKARHDYHFAHVVEAGLALLGSEVKSLRSGTPSLQDGFARFEDGELWLHGVHIPPLPQASYNNHEPRRARKCLLHARELRKLETMLEAAGSTVVPLSLYFLGSHVKVELGLGTGKRQYDKREDLKRREADRATRRAVRRG
jgi:SsrA-binding protein